MAEIENIAWPGWDIGDCIGKGGYGAVYEIRREVFGDVERCALKVITIPKDASEIEYMRCEGIDDDSITTTLHAQVGDIIREYKIMSRMRENPNIVHCDDFRYTRHEKDLGWDIYIKMELLTPLMKALDRVKTEAQIILLGKDLCNALMDCQEVNIIHRDIKPQNIFLSPKGHFKLGDFGIARTLEHTTKATAGIGTYSFMAPEVALGKSYGSTVDIYSLGLVLYWLLNERRGPFVPLPPAIPTVAINEEARVRRYSGEQIPPPKHGSKELRAVVLKACAYDPEERYKTAREMAEALDNLKKSDSVMEQKDVVPSINIKDETTVIELKALTQVPKAKFYKESIPEDKKAEDEGDLHQKEAPIRSSKKKKWIWFMVAGSVAILVFVIVLISLGSIGKSIEHKDPGRDSIDSEYQTQELFAESTIPESTMEESPVWINNTLMADMIDKAAFNEYFNGKRVSAQDILDFYSQQYVLGSLIRRSEIQTVTFLDTLADASESCWDVSSGKNGSVLAWVTENGAFFDLYIAGEGGINGAEACRELFCGYCNTVSINFNGCFYTDYSKDTEDMFYGCSSLTELDISHFNTSNVTSMGGMFYGCSSLTELDVSCFDTSNVTQMGGMFCSCEKLTVLDLHTFVTSNVTNMSVMFSGCRNLSSLNTDGFDTSNVCNMGFMFQGCKKLTAFDISCFDVSKVENYEYFMDEGKKIEGRPWKEMFE